MNPTDVASALVDADTRQSVEEVLELTHPEAADLFRERQLRALRDATWDELKYRAGPRAKRLRAAVKQNRDYVLGSAYRVSSLDELRALPPMELLRRRLAEAYRAVTPALKMHISVIGGLSLDTDTQYVVLERRDRVAHPRPLRVEVMTVRRDGPAWRSMVDGGLQGGGLFALGVENNGLSLPL